MHLLKTHDMFFSYLYLQVCWCSANCEHDILKDKKSAEFQL